MLKERRNLFCMAAAFVLALVMTMSVHASAEEQTDKGSIRIVLKDLETEGSDRAGVTFRLWKVGTADTDSVPSLDRQYGINEYPQDSESLDKTAGQLADLVEESPNRTGTTGTDGRFEFTDMESGIYLICAEEPNSYGTISPFLVQIPYYEEVAGQMEGPVWQVTAEPKASVDTEEQQEPGKPGPEESEPEKPNQENQDSTKKENVQTGIQDQAIVWMVLATVSIVFIVVIYKKKKGDELSEKK